MENQHRVLLYSSGSPALWVLLIAVSLVHLVDAGSISQRLVKNPPDDLRQTFQARLDPENVKAQQRHPVDLTRVQLDTWLDSSQFPPDDIVMDTLDLQDIRRLDKDTLRESFGLQEQNEKTRGPNLDKRQSTSRSAAGEYQFVALGPIGGARDGQVENIPDGPVSGAVVALAAHPTDPDILYLASVNGGVWKTTSATSTIPTWTPLFDSQESLSISAMKMDPSNPDVLLAVIGRRSSLSRIGGSLAGAMITRDAGTTWTTLSSDLVGYAYDGGHVYRDNIVLVVSCFVGPATDSGVFTSTDGGSTFLNLGNSNGGKDCYFDLATDTSQPNRIYAPQFLKGIMRSDDGGLTWVFASENDIVVSRIMNAQVNATAANMVNNVRISVSPTTGRLFIAISINGQLKFIAYSDDFGVSFTEMDTPITTESNGDSEGLSPREKPGAQGFIHASLVAHPTNPNLLFVGGDRQDSPFPNALLAQKYTGRLFRGDTTRPRSGPGVANSSQWQHLTHSTASTYFPRGGTPSSSAPHADSRAMTFLANGVLVEGDDGGIYGRASPEDNRGDWFSMIGLGLCVTEIHSVAYSGVGNLVAAGTQDNSVLLGNSASDFSWTTRYAGDGGDVSFGYDETDNQIWLSLSAQFLGGFHYQVFDGTSLEFLGYTFPTGSGLETAQPVFYTTAKINRFAINQLLFLCADAIYLSNDFGDNFVSLAYPLGPAIYPTAAVYGGMFGGVEYPDVIVACVDNRLVIKFHVSTQLQLLFSFTASWALDVTVDPSNYLNMYVIGGAATPFAGGILLIKVIGAAQLIDVTGNLFSDYTCVDSMFSVMWIPSTKAALNRIAVGTNCGVYVAFDSEVVEGHNLWVKLGGDSLPNALVSSMDFYYGGENDKRLIVGTLGRGAFQTTLDDSAVVSCSPVEGVSICVRPVASSTCIVEPCNTVNYVSDVEGLCECESSIVIVWRAENYTGEGDFPCQMTEISVLVPLAGQCTLQL